MKNNQNILILGGSGRIGSQIVKSLITKGHQIYVMDKKKNKNLKNNKMIICDISKQNHLITSLIFG